MNKEEKEDTQAIYTALQILGLKEMFGEVSLERIKKLKNYYQKVAKEPVCEHKPSRDCYECNHVWIAEQVLESLDSIKEIK